MRKISSTLTGSVLVAAAATGCAPRSSFNDTKRFANVNVRLETRESPASALAPTSAAGLPPGLCYFVHVSAPDLQRLSPTDDVCGPDVGQNFVSPRAYSVGESAELQIKVGLQRRFDVVGVPSPLGTQNGKAICGELETQISPLLPPAQRVVYKIGGQAISPKMIVFYSGKADVMSGIVNTVTLAAVPFVLHPLTAAYGQGAPYNRADRGLAPPGCAPSTRAINTRLLTFTGSSPNGSSITSSSGSASLIQVTLTPFISPSPVPAQSGPALELHTGLIEILNAE